MSNCSRRKKGDTKRGGPISNNNLPIEQLLLSLPPSNQPIQYKLSYILHHFVTYSLHPFSTPLQPSTQPIQYALSHSSITLLHIPSTPLSNSNAIFLSRPLTKIHPTTLCPTQFYTYHLPASADLSNSQQPNRK